MTTIRNTTAWWLGIAVALGGAVGAQPPAEAPEPEEVTAEEPAAPEESTEVPTATDVDVAAGPADAAAPRRILPVEPTTAAVRVDGTLDEVPWQQPPTFTLDYETSPGDNVPPPVATEVWVTHDERQLYIAVRAHDPQPELIRARLRDRDAAFQDDFVGVVLDTFNDERRAFEFFVNPLGVQMDLTQNDITGGEDASWDALWDSAGRVTARGYEVEMAIPFSSLRFPATSGEQTWGIDAVRIWPRDQRRRIGLNRLPRGRNCYLCHTAKLVGFAGITPGRNIELAPTLTAADVAQRPGPGLGLESDTEIEGGLTGRWGITPGTTLSAAVNPDFSQVEADAAQLAVNNQFALFFAEKRPFFLEGADLFETRINGVYTRTIADPDWGLKVTGKSGTHAYGAIVAQDARTNLLLPSSQSSRLAGLEQDNVSTILRYRRDLAGSSALGGLFTSREGDGYFNRVAGVDGIFRWGEGTAFRLEVLGSQTEYPGAFASAFGQPLGSQDGLAIRAAYQVQDRDWMGYALYNDVSPDFRADLGFIPRADFRSGFGQYERYWYADEGEKWWTRFTAGVETTWTYDHDDEPLQTQVAPYFWFDGPRQSHVNIYLGLGPSWYRGEEIERNFVNFFSQMQATSDVYVGLQGRIGQEIDFANGGGGDLVRLIPQARFDLGQSLRLNVVHNYETLDISGGTLYTANLTELRASYQFNVRTFLRLITQYSDLERDPGLYTFPIGAQSTDLFNQLLFSYKISPQTVLFLGYSDAHLGQEQGFSGLEQSNRTLFLKVGYALVL